MSAILCVASSLLAQQQQPRGQHSTVRRQAFKAAPMTAARPSSVVRASAAPREQQHLPGGQIAAGVLGVAVSLSLACAAPALAAEGFLKSTGARGFLAQEEEQLLALRQQRESEAQKELQAARTAYEEELRKEREAFQPDQLCATPYGVDVVGITEFVALTGALVGGISARRRKQELEKLNEQLRTINTQLRQQARAGTLYAPGLTYVPNSPLPETAFNGNGAAAAVAALAAAIATPPPPASAAAAPAATEPAAAAPAVPAAATPAAGTASNPSISLMSQDDDEISLEAQQCTQALKDGKRLLKDGSASAAMVRFEKALMLAKQSLGDRVKERRATRGLAACARMQGQLRQAVKHLERVLDISREIRDFVGDADAYGTIADIYTDMGEFEKAAVYYDKYISRMDDSVV